MIGLESDTETEGEVLLKLLHSIAISLKRIADKLELSQKQSIIMTSEEFAEYKKSYDTHPGLGVKV